MEEIDIMEDSGFDSDQKPQNGSANADNSPVNEAHTARSADKSGYKVLRKTSELQKKLEKQREINRKSQGIVDFQPKKVLPSRSRLIVPGKKEMSHSSPDKQPLVVINSDDSDDEFSLSSLNVTAQKEIAKQLIKDGYNLDIEPDDEDLDLIPPRPLAERCTCCQFNQQIGCIVQ